MLLFLELSTKASTICIDEKEAPLGTASIAQASCGRDDSSGFLLDLGKSYG